MDKSPNSFYTHPFSSFNNFRNFYFVYYLSFFAGLCFANWFKKKLYEKKVKGGKMGIAVYRSCYQLNHGESGQYKAMYNRTLLQENQMETIRP